jgi:hypothetical protein
MAMSRSTLYQIALGLGLLISAENAQAEPNEAAYEFAERCGKSAAEYFQKHYGNPPADTDVSFENHYNQSLNKCFILIKSTRYTKFNGKDYHYISTNILKDLHDNKTLAYYHEDLDTSHAETLISECRVADALTCVCSHGRLPRICDADEAIQNPQKWQAAIKPYMEE